MLDLHLEEYLAIRRPKDWQAVVLAFPADLAMVPHGEGFEVQRLENGEYWITFTPEALFFFVKVMQGIYGPYVQEDWLEELW